MEVPSQHGIERGRQPVSPASARARCPPRARPRPTRVQVNIAENSAVLVGEHPAPDNMPGFDNRGVQAQLPEGTQPVRLT